MASIANSPQAPDASGAGGAPVDSAFAQRAAAKAASRAADERALASGEISREQLRAENSHFRAIAHEPIDWSRVKRLA